VVVSEWTLEPSGALMDTFGTSGPLAEAPDAGATVASGAFFRAPGGT
jgi:hypothetical protein